MLYRIELEDDNFEIITARNDEEAIQDALHDHDLVLNVIRIDDDYNDIKTIF